MVSPGKIVVDKTWQRYRVGRGVSAAPLRSVPGKTHRCCPCIELRQHLINETSLRVRGDR